MAKETRQTHLLIRFVNPLHNVEMNGLTKRYKQNLCHIATCASLSYVPVPCQFVCLSDPLIIKAIPTNLTFEFSKLWNRVSAGKLNKRACLIYLSKITTDCSCSTSIVPIVLIDLTACRNCGCPRSRLLCVAPTQQPH